MRNVGNEENEIPNPDHDEEMPQRNDDGESASPRQRAESEHTSDQHATIPSGDDGKTIWANQPKTVPENVRASYPKYTDFLKCPRYADLPTEIAEPNIRGTNEQRLSHKMLQITEVAIGAIRAIDLKKNGWGVL